MKKPLMFGALAFLLAATLLAIGHQASVAGGERFDTPYVPTVTLLCLGLNAPATLLMIPAAFNLLRQWSFLGFADSEWYFLLGVAVTWFTVGRTLNRPLIDSGREILRWVLRIVLVLLATWLVYAGLFQTRMQPYNNPFGNKLEATLFMLWAIVLLMYCLRFHGTTVRIARN